MRDQSSGPLTTFLMFIPLVAVPVLAVVGIPDFSAVKASPSNEMPDFQFKSAVEFGETERHSADDLFAPISIHSGHQQDGESQARTPNAADIAASDPFRRIAFEDQQAGADSGAVHGPDADSRPHPPSDANAAWGGVDFGSDANGPIRLDRSTPPIRTVGGDPARGFVRSTGSIWDKPTRNGPAVDRSPGNGLALQEQQLSAVIGSRGFAESPAFSQEFLPRFFDGSPLLCERLMRPERNDSPATNRLSFAHEDSLVRRQGPKQRHPAAHAAMPSDKNAGRTSSRLTWRSAVAWLNQRGIDHYQLQPGNNAAEFHFSCAFTPSDNPRITHRFEAEAAEPLRAVEKVLAQIADWERKHSNPRSNAGGSESIDPQFGFGVE